MPGWGESGNPQNARDLQSTLSLPRKEKYLSLDGHDLATERHDLVAPSQAPASRVSSRAGSSPAHGPNVAKAAPKSIAWSLIVHSSMTCRDSKPHCFTIPSDGMPQECAVVASSRSIMMHSHLRSKDKTVEPGAKAFQRAVSLLVIGPDRNRPYGGARDAGEHGALEGGLLHEGWRRIRGPGQRCEEGRRTRTMNTAETRLSLGSG